MNDGTAQALPCVLLLLVGPPAAGKSSFAEAMVQAGLVDASAIVSCDTIRQRMFGQDADSDAADPAVFAHMDQLVRQRLQLGLAVVVDATNVTSPARLRMIRWAKETRRPVWAARFTVDVAVALEQNAGREKVLPDAMVIKYAELMNTSAGAGQLLEEGVDVVFDVPGRRENVAPHEAARRTFATHRDGKS